jgi:predicted double-glycine peptidase
MYRIAALAAAVVVFIIGFLLMAAGVKANELAMNEAGQQVSETSVEATTSGHGCGIMTTLMLNGVPDVRQSEYYSCGAAAFQAVLSYYGISSFETDLRTMLNTSATHGTYSWDMVTLANKLGFEAEWRDNVTLADIASSLRKGIPVITRSQAMKEPSAKWEDTWTVGHYMVVYGMGPRNIYIEDPYLIGVRRVMSCDDFVASWHSYVSEVPIPPDAPKVYHEAVFIRGTPPKLRPSTTDYNMKDWPPLLQPEAVQPWTIVPPPCTKHWPHCPR